MSGERVSFPGQHVALHDAQVLPQPVQRPHPPIWIGGSGMKRTLPIAARFADAWHTYGSPDQLAKLSAHLEDLAAASGRDPRSILRASSLSLSEPWDEVLANAEAMRDAGVGYLVCGWPSEGEARVAAFVERVLPRLG
jgi:alkanesulfonate monooxygenase SsuD/methylene tetrahydromethanopterin reductase-like flavin-dependent oxidoreductase (luciferase family)